MLHFYREQETEYPPKELLVHSLLECLSWKGTQRLSTKLSLYQWGNGGPEMGKVPAPNHSESVLKSRLGHSFLTPDFSMWNHGFGSLLGMFCALALFSRVYSSFSGILSLFASPPSQFLGGLGDGRETGPFLCSQYAWTYFAASFSSSFSLPQDGSKGEASEMRQVNIGSDPGFI